jgi:predicted MFS family arabinose efflux permease
VQAGTRLVLRLGLTQIIGWGSGFYLPAILAVPISLSLGISTETFFWAFTLSLLVSGLLGPQVGKAIDGLGGRKVLPIGTLAFAIGLALLATSTSTPQLFIAWILMGVGGSMGNYDAAFATAVNFFGNKSNGVIAGITVVAGFSSTVAWPLTQALFDNFGWQVAVWVWFGLHVLVALPLHLTIPRSERRVVPDLTGPIRKLVKNRFRIEPLLIVFALMFALEGFIVSAVNTTLPFMLGELGASIELALIASVVLGPSQVLARVVLVALGSRARPLWVATISIVAHPLGVAAIWILGDQGLLVFVVLHGIGVGLNPFIRGSLPLLFYGPDRFGQRQGRVMMLSKVVSAFSPAALIFLLLINPQIAIGATFAMGTIASLMLIWVYFEYKRRNPKHPETGEIREIN